jgi:hypothetical protein
MIPMQNAWMVFNFNNVLFSSLFKMYVPYL